MRLFKKPEEKLYYKRLPMLPELTASGLPEAPDGSWCADDTGVNYMELVYENMHIDDSRENNIHAIPDMLKQSKEFSRRLLSHNPALYHGPMQAWLGTLCTIAFAENGIVTRIDISLTEILKDINAPFFLRALAKNLSEQEPPIQSISLFMHRTDDIISEDVPIAFSYPGLPILICPAAEISQNIYHYAPPWYKWEEYEDLSSETKPKRHRGEFINPIPILRQPEYIDRSTALYKGLGELAKSHAQLGHVIREAMGQLLHEDDILGGYRLRSDLLPELAAQEDAYLSDRKKVLVEGFFSDVLCLFDLRKNTRESRQKSVGSFENSYGNHIVYAKEDDTPVCEAILPLSENFAKYLLDLKDEEARRILEGLAENIKIIKNNSEPASYLLIFSWEGKEYQKLYGAGTYTKLSELERRYMPTCALWPSEEDPRGIWQHYYAYYAYDIEDSWDISMQVIHLDKTDMPKWDRNTGLVGTRRDYVIETNSFPKYIQVFEKNTPVGLILVKPKGQAKGPMGEERVIGLDYGTTSTIAYYKNANDGSAANEYIIPEQLLPISGITDENTAQRMTLDFINLSDLGTGLFLSLIHIHGAANGNIKPFEMANVLFANKLQLEDDMKDRIFMNLKLSNQRADLEKIRAFLRQVIMMYMWDAYRAGVSKIYWRFSYPRSISHEMLEMFLNNIRGILRELSYGEYKCVFRSEAEAIGSFITAPTLMTKIMENNWAAVSSSAGYLCMDIGGGTVDFSLWQKRDKIVELCAEASLLNLAGNFILCDTITHEFDQGVKPRVALLKEILHGAKGSLGELSTILEKLEKPSTEREKLYKRFKMLWATHIQEISNSISEHHLDLGLDECVNLRGYLNMIELYLCMLFYFSGMIVGAAVQENQFSIKEDETFSILLTGNGARMLEWLPQGSLAHFRGSPLYNRLGLSFFAGQKISGKLKMQIISPFMAKREVSYGLTHQTEQLAIMEEATQQETSMSALFEGMAALQAKAHAPSAAALDEGDDFAQEYLANQTNQKNHMDTQREIKNLEWIEKQVTDVAGKETLKELFDNFWNTLEYAHQNTGGQFKLFINNLYGANTKEEMMDKSRSIITALDDDSNEYSNNMAGMFARTARSLISLIK